MNIKLQPSKAADLKTYCGHRIWQKPKEGAIYAIGADVAEGTNSDASCASVIDCRTGMHVACYWSNNIDTDNYAVELYKLGHWYNKAFICIEANNHGHSVISHLSGAIGGLAYPNLYKRMTFDQFTQKRTKTVGFHTNAQTKPFLIENLKKALKLGDLITADGYTIREMNGFIRDNTTGRLGAPGRAHDDRVIALALAWEQARILAEGSRITEESSGPSIKYDASTGFPVAESFNAFDNLF
jgi:hypothetical protein